MCNVIKASSNEENAICPICFDSFDEKEAQWTHEGGEKHAAFHRICLRDWIFIKPECPIDRRRINRNSILTRTEQISRILVPFAICSTAGAFVGAATLGIGAATSVMVGKRALHGMAISLTGAEYGALAGVTFRMKAAAVIAGIIGGSFSAVLMRFDGIFEGAGIGLAGVGALLAAEKTSNYLKINRENHFNILLGVQVGLLIGVFVCLITPLSPTDVLITSSLLTGSIAGGLSLASKISS